MGGDLSKQIESANSVPPFSLVKPRYDQGSFIGRTLHFYSVNDPRTLLSSSEDLKNAIELLDKYKHNKLDKPVSDEVLWSSRRLIESAIHPDTKEPINPLLRFSAFAPVNFVIVTATLSPIVLRSFLATGCIHLINQTYNAAINYANRNASNPISTKRLMEGYFGAVATSLSIGLTATALTQRAIKVRPSAAGMIRSTLPFLATAGAGFANVALMRRNELVDGVDMRDSQGNSYGKSKIAGQTGIAKCALARLLWNIPIMMMPPLIMTQLEKTALLIRNPRLKVAIELGLITTCLLGFVSPSLAVFPQKDILQVADLEPEFKGLKDENGREITELWYNKGL